MSHFLIMVVHALLIAVFFAFLTRDRAAGRLKVFLVLFGALLAGALALAWIMYPYPVQGGA